MSGTISAIIGVLDSAGVRVDLPAPDGTYKPLMLQIDASFTATQVDNGSTTIIKLSVANPPPAGDTWTPFAEFTLIDSTPHDTLVYTFPTAPGGKTYQGSIVGIFCRPRWAADAGSISGVGSGDGALLVGASGAVSSAGVDYASCGVGGTVPVTTTPAFVLYVTGNAGDKAVYMRATGGGVSYPCTVNGEFLIVPTLKLTDIPT